MSQKENNKFPPISINFNKFLIGIIIFITLFLGWGGKALASDCASNATGNWSIYH